jgi:hypothetical protein
VTFHESGAKKSSGQRADGLPDGDWSWFAQDGTETQSCRYEAGVVVAGVGKEAGAE